MSTPSIVVILGNRPQFVKHGAIVKAWREANTSVRQLVVDTGQHYDHALAGVFIDELNIPEPDYSLGVGSASHAEQLARIIVPLEEILIREKPASVLLYGDTNSTLAGAIVASKLNIPIAHVEAGLRSFDMRMPEEVNRIMTDHVSTLLFAPTDAAVENLEREGITGERVHRTGDVMADVALSAAKGSEERFDVMRSLLAKRGIVIPPSGEYAVATIHRASNTEAIALSEVIEALSIVAQEIPIVFPIHPRTEAAAEKAGLHVDLTAVQGLTLLPPLGYGDMTALLRGARVALTDSGGLQKEAYIHGVPCVTLRDRTEWVETVDTGWNIVSGIEPSAVHEAVLSHLAAFGYEPWYAERPDLYGTGDAAQKIVDVLIRHASAPAPL